MLTVDQHAAIRQAYHNEDRSIREIARDLDVSRQSVRKALSSPTPARYTQHRQRPAPKLASFHARIVALLEEQALQPRKQRYTGVKIFELLTTEGYTGSASHLRAYIGRIKQQRTVPKTFLPLQFAPGQDAQVDWGEAQVVIAGKTVTVQLFVMRLCYAHRTFACCFPTQRQEAFFAGHVAAFDFFGGVPHRISYDNLTTAVAPIFTGRTRSERTAFTAFRSCYLFDSHFCNLNAGHEKGQVEHGVGYVRRNALVPLPQVSGFSELNAYLAQWCLAQDTRRVHGQPAAIGVMWAEERPRLRALPMHPFPCCVTVSASRTPYAQVVFETNRYSIPVDRPVRRVVLRAFPFHVEVLDGAAVIATHPRSYEREQDVLDPLHYLPLLVQRPGAFDHARPIQQWRTSWPECYLRLLTRLRRHWPDGRGVRESLAVLALHQTFPAAPIAAAVEQAVRVGCVSADGVKLCLRQLLQEEPPQQPLDLHDRPQLAAVAERRVDLAVYEQLLHGGRA